MACMSARIRVADFMPSRTHRRIIRRNADLERKPTNAWATEEQYELFRRYLDQRHTDGGMANMDIFEFATMIEESAVRTRVIEYRGRHLYRPEGSDPDLTDADLAAACLTDVLDDGLSLVYSFFDLRLKARSLGTYIILDHVALAREAGLPYVYLGYWVPGSRKMDYKSRFSALEIYKGGVWQDIGNPADHFSETHPLAVEPIVEQVEKISLPPGLK